MSWTSALPNWMQMPPPDGRSESQIDDDLNDEIGFHLEQIERELREAGQDAEAARGLARLRFGDVESIKRRCRRIAMKERTMLQRINFVMMAVVMLLVIGVAVQVMITQRYNTLALQAITTEITNMKYNALAAERGGRSDSDARSGGSVYLDGAVARPGQFELPAGGQLTFRRLVAARGGFSGNTGDMTVVITQLGTDGLSRVRTQADRVARDGTDDFVLMANDHVHVGLALERTLFQSESPTKFHGLPGENCTWRQVDGNGKLIESGATISYYEYNDVRSLNAFPTGSLRLPNGSEQVELEFRGEDYSSNLMIRTGPRKALSQGRWQIEGGTLIINIAPALPEIVEPLRFVRESNESEQVSPPSAKTD